MNIMRGFLVKFFLYCLVLIGCISYYSGGGFSARDEAMTTEDDNLQQTIYTNAGVRE